MSENFSLDSSELSYEERKPYRTVTYLTFYKVTSAGAIFPIMIDTDNLIDSLSVSAVMGKIKTTETFRLMYKPVSREDEMSLSKT